MAADVHDSVIQDLAGLRYAVTSAARHLPPDSSPEVRSVLSAADDILYRTVLRLRGLLHDADPPEARRAGNLSDPDRRTRR